MRNNFVLVAALLTVFGVLPGVLWHLTTPAMRISRESFEQIRTGMTCQDVEEIIGAPPGDYRSERAKKTLCCSSLKQIVLADPDKPLEWNVWRGDHTGAIVTISVAFDSQGKVADKTYWQESASNRSLFQQYLQFAGW